MITDGIHADPARPLLTAPYAAPSARSDGRMTVSFKTLGCRLNQAETARLRTAFEAAGYIWTPFGEPAAVCVIHGCTITAQAEKDSVRAARQARRANPQTFVVLAGCVAEVGGEALTASAGADLAVGQTDKFRLPELLARHGWSLPTAAAPDAAAARPRFETTRALVKAQDGCDFRCAYCIVPAARGAPRSRPQAEIVAEIEGLIADGFKEVVLTGANLGCYDDGGASLVALLTRVESLAGLERIRLSSIEMSTVEYDVIRFMARSRKLCRFLHLPLQSGDDGLLRAMGRRYSARQYQDLVEYAAREVEGIGLGTDVLVGFPGEDEAAFDQTRRLIEALPFNNLHIFAYSRRPGTPACEMKDQVNAAVKKRRVTDLIALGREKRAAFARRWIGREVTVLVESVEASGEGTGWTGEYVAARVRGRLLQSNQVVRMTPDRVEDETLVGQAVSLTG